MKATELKTLAEKIGNELQDAAEQAGRLGDEIDDVARYPYVADWVEQVRDLGEELVAELDLLAESCAEKRDEIGAALAAEPELVAERKR